MTNPFEVIDARLNNIENLLLDLKHNPSSKNSGNNSDELITISKAAEFLKLSIPTIYSKVSKGELPYMKRSKRLYFSRKELTDYLIEGRNESNKDIVENAGQYVIKSKRRS